MLFDGVLPTEWLIAHSSRESMIAWEKIDHVFCLFMFLSLTLALRRKGCAAVPA